MQFNQNKKDNKPGKDNGNDQPPQPTPPQDWRRFLWPTFFLVFILWIVLTSGSFLGGATGSATEIPYSVLRNNVEQIRSIEFAETTVRGMFSEPVEGTLPDGSAFRVQRFSSEIPLDGTGDLLTIISERNPSAVVTSNPPQTSPLLLLLLNFGPFLLIIAFFIWMSRRAQGQMNGVFGFGRSQAREYDPEMPRITFEDVAGQDAAKQDLVEVVDFLSNPEKYISLGARIPRGVLLVGPPGTGKTLMARAVAGEANVAFYSIAASEFVEMFVGVGASRVRDLFNKAKENSPSIVFIDEIDAVGRQRGAGLGGGNDEREQTLNQMLAEMDGFDQSSTVVVMAATNRPDVLDPALLRPGRFDRQVTVDLPDRTGRLAILKIHSRGKPLAEDVKLDSIASATIGFSGADLANLANEAALNAARNNRKKILQKDFSAAFERILLGTERPPLSNQEERKVVAYHEAGHAVAALLTPGADQVLKVTITPRGQALGITAFMPEDDRRNYSRRYLEATMIVALGGRVAEEVIFDDITTGASNDLKRVTDIARRMVAQFGMSEEIGPLNFGENDTQPFLGYTLSQGRHYSEETAARIDAEVHRLVDIAYKNTRKLLTENRDKLDGLAQALLDREVIERDEVLEIVGITGSKELDAAELLQAQKEEAPANGDEEGVWRTPQPRDPLAGMNTDKVDAPEKSPESPTRSPEQPSDDQPPQDQ